MSPDQPMGSPCTPAGTTYFTPHVQAALDSLGCTAAKCHGDRGNDPFLTAGATGAQLMQNYRSVVDLLEVDPGAACGDDTDLISAPQGDEHPGGVYSREMLAPLFNWLLSGAPFSEASNERICACVP
jgi:hypothetical protein